MMQREGFQIHNACKIKVLTPVVFAQNDRALFYGLDI